MPHKRRRHPLLRWSKYSNIKHWVAFIFFNAELVWRVNAQATPVPTSVELKRVNYAGNPSTPGMWCVGITASGFELDAAGGRTGAYTVPMKEALQHFHLQGSNCFRLPITWERLQAQLGDATLSVVPHYETHIDWITGFLGDYVIIDVHNSEQGLKFNGINAAKSDFVNLWSAIATRWRTNQRVIFGLFNMPRNGLENGVTGYFDPYAQDTSGAMLQSWREWTQAAISAIRVQSANNLVLVAGLKMTNARFWDGTGDWGESLDGKQYAGNTRLAALDDPIQNLAYDVHQFMDDSFNGTQAGCGGHDLYQGAISPGATVGLSLIIAWAVNYNKKLMMTEIGSFDAGDGTGPACQTKMASYLQTMSQSNVFIGYQVWQFGCTTCLGDQWSQRPSNLVWYNLQLYGLSPKPITTQTFTTTAVSGLTTTLGTTTTNSGLCALSVKVKGAEAVQGTRMGLFQAISTQYGRPIYQNANYEYLYFSTYTASWLIGSDYTKSNAGVASMDGEHAACPFDASGWRVATRTGFSTNYNIIITNPNPSLSQSWVNNTQSQTNRTHRSLLSAMGMMVMWTCAVLASGWWVTDGFNL